MSSDGSFPLRGSLNEAGDGDEDERGDERREVKGAEGREDAPEEPDVRLTDVVQEALYAGEPDRVRELHERAQHVQQDQEEVDVAERHDEVADEAQRACKRDRGE